MEKLIYIIILSFNGRKWIEGCLSSVLAIQYPEFHVVIVDNASEDGSADYISKNYPNIKLIKNKKNYGFAQGNNIGIKYCLEQGAEYIVLLNQDTKVDPKWLSELIVVAEDNADFGIMTPMQYDYEGDTIDAFFREISSLSSEYKEDLKETKTVIGASMLIKREVIMKIGMFDPIYFCYVEEDDFCRRALYHGFRIGVALKSKIFHWGTTAHVEGALDRRRKSILKRNGFIYDLKNPEGYFLLNLLRYFWWQLHKQIEQFGRIRGIIGTFGIFCNNIKVIFYIPLILYRRIKDKRGYL